VILDWESIIEQHGRALVLYARQWTHCHADAEDAVQDGILRVLRSSREPEGEPLPYLYTAVKWCALDRLRSDSRRGNREQKSEGLRESTAMFESTIESMERTHHIESALSRLPAEQREVLVMKIWGELTFKMIAEALGISQNTAASRYRYALNALRGEMQREVVNG
jgi:RNA polymerase sigma-70 factor (ECF subfamily)